MLTIWINLKIVLIVLFERFFYFVVLSLVKCPKMKGLQHSSRLSRLPNYTFTFYTHKTQGTFTITFWHFQIVFKSLICKKKHCQKNIFIFLTLACGIPEPSLGDTLGWGRCKLWCPLSRGRLWWTLSMGRLGWTLSRDTLGCSLSRGELECTLSRGKVGLTRSIGKLACTGL